MVHMGESSSKRVTVNLRVDADKLVKLEQIRIAGFGISESTRKRSDMVNEVLGYGLLMYQLKSDLGDREFRKLWNILMSVDFRRLNLEKIEAMVRK